MRKIGAILSVVLCGALFMGSVGVRAPVLPSKNFYINDHAEVIDIEYRDAMLETSLELFDKTGAQVVVLTVQSLIGMSVEDYAESVFTGWDIGGETGNGVLILFPTSSEHALIYVGEGLKGILTEEKIKRVYRNDMDSKLKRGNYSEGLYAGFINTTKSVFDYYGEKTSVAKPKKQSEFSMDSSYVLILILGSLIVLRAFRVGKRYRKRHGAPYAYKRRTYTRKPRSDYDDYPSGFGGNITVKHREFDEYGNEIEPAGEEPETAGGKVTGEDCGSESINAQE